MTEPDPATEAGGTAVANVENVPLENKDASGKIECEQKMEIGENKAKEEKDTMEKEEGIDKEDAKKNDGAIENNEDNKKVEVEDGHESKEGEVEEGDDKKEGKFEDNGDKKKQVESKDDEEKQERHQNELRNLEDIEGRKEDVQNVHRGETEGVKMLGTEDVKTGEAEDVNMINSDDVKIFDEECVKGGKGSEEEEVGPNSTDDVSKGGNGGITSVKVDIDKEVGKSKKKRSRATKASQKVGKDRKEAETKSMRFLQSPVSSIDRPVRERKTVERLVEVIEKEANREFQVEKGRGTPLKDIPNVAYKLARKTPADIKLIHQTLFGRKGKAINFKSHILQFSGFVWHESDEKQRAKMKEKLDKYVKDALLDLCDLFDLPISRANSRKEDLVAKLLDFLVAPQPTTDVIPAEGQKSRKRKRMSRDGSLKGRRLVINKLSKKRTKHEVSPTGKDSSTQETEDEEKKDAKQNDFSEQENEDRDSENEENESESEESADEDEYDEKKIDESNRGKKRAGKQLGSVSKEELKVFTSPKKSKRSSSRRIKAEDDAKTYVISRNKNLDSPKKKSTPKSNSKEKVADKQIGRGKTIPVEVEQPSKEDLRKKICEILNEADFNKATFTDILKQLAAYYKMDMTPKKASLKVMIQEELTKLSEPEEADKDNDNDVEKGRKPKSKGKYVKA